MESALEIEIENETEFNQTEFDKCDNTFTISYSLEKLLISIGMLCFGLFLGLCGYRAFRFNLWFSGFNFTFWCVLAICNRVDNLPNGADWGAAFSVGALAGCVTHLLPGVGTFLWGVYSGAIVTGVILAILAGTGNYTASPIASASLCLFVGGCTCGALILTRHWSRNGLIISTAIAGSLLVTAGLDYFCEEWRLMDYVWHQLLRLAPEPLPKPKPCWYSYVIAAIFPVFIALGIITQYMATAVKNGEKYKKKVERIYVPPTIVNVYGTIRRTLGRSRGETSVDYVPGSQNQRHSRDHQPSRSRPSNEQRSNNARQHAGRSSSSRQNMASPPSSRAARSRDRARQSGQRGQRRLAQDVFNQAAHNDQQQLLRNNPGQSQPLPQPRVNKHQAVNVVDECPPPYDEIFRVVRKSKKVQNPNYKGQTSRDIVD